MNLKHLILNRKGALDRPVVSCSAEEANRSIYELLASSEPAMIARLGAFELGMAFCDRTPLNLKNLKRLILGEIGNIGFSKKTANAFCNNAGFFPYDKKLFHRYADLLISDMHYCDILGSSVATEKYFEKELAASKKIKLRDLEPFHHKNPYTRAFEGKKILAIHPYKDSILQQWAIKDRVWKNTHFFPDFELKVFRAVQSIAGQQVHFENWFDALSYMEDEIDKIDYDIALIGCGAYGFNLAAHIKRNGKKAIHLGGVLQIFFGIMGKRWEGKYNFVNENWIRPLQSDTPQNINKVENGCYW